MRAPRLLLGLALVLIATLTVLGGGVVAAYLGQPWFGATSTVALASGSSGIPACFNCDHPLVAAVASAAPVWGLALVSSATAGVAVALTPRTARDTDTSGAGWLARLALGFTLVVVGALTVLGAIAADTYYTNLHEEGALPTVEVAGYFVPCETCATSGGTLMLGALAGSAPVWGLALGSAAATAAAVGLFGRPGRRRLDSTGSGNGAS